MSKVKAYTPSWLSKPAPGHALFQASSEDIRTSAFSSKRTAKPGPRRTIAKRGSEVFVAVNREIRWGDLVYLKQHWEHKTGGTKIKREDSTSSFSIYDDAQPSVESGEGYRVIKTPVADEIRQLVISPNSNYLAILTTHTVHICVLPDSSHLTTGDSEPMKPKFFTLGPTTHVTSRSAVMSALWHPLGVKGCSVVTVTEDAVVRVWEISTSDRWSFEAPTLAIDLKKLANGTSLDQDFSLSTMSANRGYSADVFDMEVAAAAFAVRGSGLWASMTLYIAMRSGDVYALCPLLPQLWVPPPTLIPSLSVSIVAKATAIQDDPHVSVQDKLLVQQQLDWMAEIDSQDPTPLQDTPGDQPLEVYKRPSRPGQVPRLQGPFDLEMSPDDDEQDDLDIELSDIYVIGRKMDTEELMEEEEELLILDENEQQGLSLTVICLVSTSGQVRVCLDMDGIEARWLPPKSKSRGSMLAFENDDLPSLLTFETFDIIPPAEVTPSCWPTFSDDVPSRYSLFVTYNTGITQVSLSPWVFRLEDELSAEAPAGSDTRVNLIAQARSEVERIFAEPAHGQSLAASVAMSDPDLGYFLLSATPTDAVALIFDTPKEEYLPIKTAASPTPFPEATREETVTALEFYTPRPAFHLPSVFDRPSTMPELRQRLLSSKHAAAMGQQVKLLPEALKIFSSVHQTLSTETIQLNEAVAELFRKCDTFRAELKDQVEKAYELKIRIDHITGADDKNGESDEARITHALAARRQKHAELMQRMENLKKKAQQKITRDLSDKERVWVQEVKMYDENLCQSAEDDTETARKATREAKKRHRASERFEDIKTLAVELLEQAASAQNPESLTEGTPNRSPSTSVASLKIPAEVRKAKAIQVQSLLDKEIQLYDALKGRLERLTIG
ncbi:unnamed protein product [Discula destructiva]